MKYIKIILIFFLMIIGVVATGELYQNYLSTYTEDFYCVTFYEQPDISAENMIPEIFETAKEYNLSIFYVDTTISSSHEETSNVYCDLNTKKVLKNKYQIIFGEISSLFSGKKNINYYEYTKLNSEIVSRNNSFYLIGEYADMYTYKSSLADKYAGAFPSQDGNNNFENLKNQLILIWGALAVIILMLTVYDSLLQKKRILLKSLLVRV